MQNSTYICPRCGNSMSSNNRMLHDLRCQGGNNLNQLMSINTNTNVNPDGTITETKTEKYLNGIERTTITRYDRNGNIISRQVNSNNANNNFNFNNNNLSINNNNANNNTNIQRTVDQFGNITETKIEQLPNGQT